MATPSLNAIIEALLFVADASLTVDRLSELLPEYDRATIRIVLQELRDDYEARQAGIHLVEVAGGWQLRTRPELMPFLSRLVKGKPPRFSPSAMETLAIVAYRQPITRQEVEYLRGVDTGAILKSLLEKRLIRILGKKDIPGRPIIYGTTRDFLEIFNLNDLKGLPTLREMQALDEVPIYEVQEELPLKAGNP
ncbi:MAG: SMC-Scp complex subunit ScpB [Trichlorobacter sp.]